MPDLYSTVPLDFAQNLAYRIDLRKRADGDEKFQRQMMTACKHDILFFISSFGWLYEPRPGFNKDGIQLPTRIPFIPWPHQVPVIRKLRERLGYQDILIKKSRGEGISWIVIYLAIHDWLFQEGAKIGLVSRTEDEADDPGNLDSLMAKADFAISKMPTWMAGVKKKDWDRNLSKHSLMNYRINSQINADAATGNIFRGGRYRWAAMDEFAFFNKAPGDDRKALASSGGATNSRLFVSTVNGIGNEFHRLDMEPGGILRLTVDWQDNITRNRGLYRMEKGVPVAVDPINNPLPKGYSPLSEDVKGMFSALRLKGFKLEAGLRSPWLDNECGRGYTPQMIAQELCMDYGGSMSRIFLHDFMEKANEGVRPPLIQGNLIYHPETLEPQFDRGDDGQIKLWCPLDHHLKPPQRAYVVGSDIGTGLGGAFTSNSTIEVIDLVTMEQVLEFASNTIDPKEIGDLMIAVAKWFHNAYLAWENQGPGKSTTNQVLMRRYGNIYHRRQEWQQGQKRTKEVGWITTHDTKESLFGEIRRAVLCGELILHSKELVTEFGQYVRIGGKIEHVLARQTEDDTSMGKAHGDRVIALGVALMAARDRPQVVNPSPDHIIGEPPPGSMAARKQDWDELQKRKQDEWDDRDNADLARGSRRASSSWWNPAGHGF